VLWLPIAAVLSLIFHPTFNTGPLQLVVFFVAIWGAFLIRTMLLWLLGLISLWTTRVAAIFELYFASELLLSGRLVPLALMPAWVQRLASFLPFQWTFGFPIESLIGQLAPRELGLGLLAQLLWITIGVVLVGLVWRSGIRRFSAVGS
jgi:ABC-2 type transport system permease protein